jgi:hypothetical protein
VNGTKKERNKEELGSRTFLESAVLQLKSMYSISISLHENFVVYSLLFFMQVWRRSRKTQKENIEVENWEELKIKKKIKNKIKNKYH